MLLAELLESFKNELTPVWLAPGWEMLEIDRVTINSNRVTPTSIFVACKGVLPTSKDGHEFIAKAIEQGAAAVVLEKVPADVASWALPVWQSGNSRVDAARLAASVSGHPDRELTTVGITGTNGKSSVAFALSSLLTHLGRPCAVMGTLGVGRPDALEDWGMTTPEAEVLSSRLRQLINENFNAVAMEVSSHGLATARVAGLQFDVALFTNLSHEHLDFHETFEAYYKAKKSLFTEHAAPAGVFVLPHGGDLGRRLAEDLRGLPQRCVTWGREVGADVRASQIRLSERGIAMQIHLPEGSFDLEVPWIGEFHVENLLAVAATGYALGYDASALEDAFRGVRAPPGRMERVASAPGQTTVLVDYAHTPDALESALKTLRAVCKGRLWVVFGCGGDRDAAKRPLMGEVAARWADRIVITNDNPRSEDPVTIASAIVSGLPQGFTAANSVAALGTKNYSVALDRQQAIEAVLKCAQPTDVVLIAGKGHEKFQTVGTEKTPFDDVEVAKKALQDGEGS